MHKLFYLLTFLVCFSLNVTAQESTPLIGSQAGEPASNLIAPVLSDGVTRILVIGDAMAGGLGAGMARVAADDSDIQIVNRFNESSAISRPDIYDWAAAIPKIMQDKNFDIVVMLIGLNDRQDIRTVTGPVTFNTPEWIAAYQANTDAIIAALAAQKVKVFWLGAPPMKDAAYDADMKLITGLQKDRVVLKGATFVETRSGLSNPDGSYMEFGPDNTGQVKKLRERDGVTFLKQGNNKFGQIVLTAINASGVSTAPAEAAPVFVAPAPLPLQAGLADTPGPVFGQDDANGVAVLHETGAIIAFAAENAIKTAVAPPSVDQLFKLGKSGVAPIGRFDDFSYVAPAPAN